MSKASLIDTLNTVLANTYATYLKTQNYHWHVKGPFFHSIHEMLEEHYNDLADAVDEIAERIVIIGGKACATFSELNSKKTVTDGSSDLDAMAMVNDLVDSHNEVLKSLSTALKSAQDNDDEVSVGL